ncbi:hypothetical protein RJP21_23025 [Paenibacillus sp. VCA1]|uniref:hypothetical protein n=1 Tax=Paenibacillus sp. VCA1 TaxID=3039148 RepID=UPI002870FB7E|nr:hypothetical protein [Paenibacillus sp. VCA1]MDR9856480.1 hypothetical protein [Paenibacillus sp. VCA1]
MKRILLSLYIIALITACSPNSSKQQSLSIIDRNLDAIISNGKIQASSNPVDYINANLEGYSEILNTGNQGLDYLMNELKESADNGLREWIIAKACEDMLKDQAPDAQWASGKEWLRVYEESREK